MTSHLERVSNSSPPLVGRGTRTAPLHRSLGATVALWLAFRLYQIALGCSGDGTDVLLYHRYAGEMLSGAAAAGEFRPEYPPGALGLFLLPALGGDTAPDRYTNGFIVVTALFDLFACLLVFHRARQRGAVPLFHASLYLLMTAALWPVLYARFDVVPAALVLAALHCLDRHRDRVASTILGVAGAVKLWPFALLPIWVLWRGGMQRQPVREWLGRVLPIGAWLLAGVAIAVLPVLPLMGDHIGSSLRYHADRGLEIESTWATAVLLLQQLGLTEAKVEEAFGATQIAGDLPRALAPFATPVTFALAGLPILFTIAAWRRTAPDERGGTVRTSPEASRLLETTVLAVTLGLMLGSKVLSPQFVLWIAPLLALTVRSSTGFLVAFLIAALTTQVYPHLFAALSGYEPGRGRALSVLLVRNALLLGWYVHALRCLTKQRAPAHRLCDGDRGLQGLVLPLRPSGRHSPSR